MRGFIELSALGYTTILGCDAFNRKDYIDLTHLSVEGADKLASNLEVVVRYKSKEIIK